MLFVTFCGGSEFRIKEHDNTIVTMWGASEILLPTLAEKMIRAKETKTQQAPRNLVVTVMGATSFTTPTIAREIESMKELKASGAFTSEEMIALWQEVVAQDDLDLTESITFVGAAGKDRPSRQDELKDLERIAAKGLLSSEEFQGLRLILQGETAPALQNPDVQEKLRALVFPDPLPSSQRLPSNVYTLPQK